MALSSNSSSQAISLAIVAWNAKYCKFVIETYLKTDDSIGATQRLFH